MKAKPITIQLRNISYTLTSEEEAYLKANPTAIYLRGLFFAFTTKEKSYLKGIFSANSPLKCK